MSRVRDTQKSFCLLPMFEEVTLLKVLRGGATDTSALALARASLTQSFQYPPVLVKDFPQRGVVATILVSA